MPTWFTCYNNVVIGRVNRRWLQSPRAWDEDLAHSPIETITGARTSGAALVYSYAYLNHHVGAASAALALERPALGTFDECVLIDYGCGPGTALMALAESEFARTGHPLRVHYVGRETAHCPAVEIARELFACIQEQGLITPDSTCIFPAFGERVAYPQVPDNTPVFFALCFVLAHPYFDLPRQWPGGPVRTDPVEALANEIETCRALYRRSVNLVYVNARYHPDRPVHAAWVRLLRHFGLTHAVRDRQFQYPVFSADYITGRAGLEDWRNARFRHARFSTPNQGTSACDFKIVV